MRVHLFAKKTILFISQSVIVVCMFVCGILGKKLVCLPSNFYFSLKLKLAKLPQGSTDISHQFLESAVVPNVIRLSYSRNYFELLMYMLAKFNVNLSGVTSWTIQCLEHKLPLRLLSTVFGTINQILAFRHFLCPWYWTKTLRNSKMCRRYEIYTQNFSAPLRGNFVQVYLLI